MNNKMFHNNNNNKKMRELCSNNHAKAPKTVSKTAPNCALIQAHDTATEVIATGAIPFTFTDYLSCTSTIKLVDNVFQITECGTYMINYCVQVIASEAAIVQLFIYIPNCGQHSACPIPNPITSTNWTPIEYSRKSITSTGSISGTYQIEIKNKCALIGLFNVGVGVLTLDQDKSPNTFINIFRVCSG